MNVDRILTIHDYYDGPRLGIAECNGVPHIYEAEFDHSMDEYSDTYFLSPIPPELLVLVLEDWEIWLRWEEAHKRGKVDVASHPALPEERARHEELKLLIGNRLRTDPLNRFCCKAKFSVSESRALTVRWKRQ